MEDAPILQITVLEGKAPRNGEILVCKPDSTIRIGRVMKGNNLALRDPGISQNHLCFRFIPHDFGWFVSDLDTSNGTKLNGSPIQPSLLVRVSDGDLFQIGEKTLLGVKIVAQPEGPARRVTRSRRGVDVNLGANSSRVSGEEERVRGCKKDETVHKKGMGRGRGKTNAARVLEKEEPRDAEEPEQNEEANVRRNPPRRGRPSNSKVLKEIDGNSVVDSALGAKEVGVKRKGRGTTSTVSKEDKENCDNIVLKMDEDKDNDDGSLLKLDIKGSDTDHVAIPEPRKGIRARSSVVSSLIEEEDDAGVEDVRAEGEEQNGEESRVDFETMTLGEWFDSMEVVLPKMIREESERIIALLKEKARMFDELLEADSDAA